MGGSKWAPLVVGVALSGCIVVRGGDEDSGTGSSGVEMPVADDDGNEDGGTSPGCGVPSQCWGDDTGGSSTGADSGESDGGYDGDDSDDGPPSTTNGGGGDGPPPDPSCSVQEVTAGVLSDPLPKGNGAGQFPVSVGNVLEDYCGCHTLMSSDQNLKFEFLKPPADTLFLDLSDVTGTLGDHMAQEVTGSQSMPPGSCYFPAEPEAVLTKWFNEGRPDGTNFEPP